MNLRESFDYQFCFKSLYCIILIIFHNKYSFIYNDIRFLERNLCNVRIIVFQLRDFIFDDLKSMKIIYEIVNCFFIKFRYQMRFITCYFFSILITFIINKALMCFVMRFSFFLSSFLFRFKANNYNIIKTRIFNYINVKIDDYIRDINI